MSKKQWLWLIGGGLTIILVLIGFQQWRELNPKAESLTEQEAKSLMEQRYKGEVTEIKQENGRFLMELVRNDVHYQIKLGADNGEVLSFEKIDSETSPAPQPNEAGKEAKTEEEIKQLLTSQTEGELVSLQKYGENGKTVYEAVFQQEGQKTIIKADAFTGEIVSSETIKSQDPAVRITEAEASEIALGQVKGVVDDIELETDNDSTYYLVEVETEDEREAVIQIHAISGKVLSVTWDD